MLQNFTVLIQQIDWQSKKGASSAKLIQVKQTADAVTQSVPFFFHSRLIRRCSKEAGCLEGFNL